MHCLKYLLYIRNKTILASAMHSINIYIYMRSSISNINIHNVARYISLGYSCKDGKCVKEANCKKKNDVCGVRDPQTGNPVYFREKCCDDLRCAGYARAPVLICDNL